MQQGINYLKNLAKALNLATEPRVRVVKDEFAENSQEVQLVDNFGNIDAEIEDYMTYGSGIWSDSK